MPSMAPHACRAGTMLWLPPGRRCRDGAAERGWARRRLGSSGADRARLAALACRGNARSRTRRADGERRRQVARSTGPSAHAAETARAPRPCCPRRLPRAFKPIQVPCPEGISRAPLGRQLAHFPARQRGTQHAASPASQPASQPSQGVQSEGRPGARLACCAEPERPGLFWRRLGEGWPGATAPAAGRGPPSADYPQGSQPGTF
jgi:hypothetical protein